MPARKTLAQSYEEKVVKNITGCWGWIGAINHNGYAVFAADGTYKRAHVYIWELTNGPVPPGKQVLHKCDNRSCSRLECLFLGTHADNMRDMVKKRRQAYGIRKAKQAKLSDQAVLEIRSRYRPRLVSHAELAREFGVSRELIRDVVNMKRWRHVT